MSALEVRHLLLWPKVKRPSGEAPRQHGLLYFSQLILRTATQWGFLKAYPWSLRRTRITREGLGDLISDGYDLAIRFGVPRPSTLVARRLLDTRVLTVALARLPEEASATPPTRSSWSQDRHRMIDFRQTRRRAVPSCGRSAKVAREITVEMTQSQLMLSDVATMHAVCLAGYGIAQVLELGVDRPSLEWATSGPLSGLGGGALPPCNAYHPSRQYLAPKTRAFLEFLSTTVKNPHHRAKQFQAEFETPGPGSGISWLCISGSNSDQRRYAAGTVICEKALQQAPSIGPALCGQCGRQVPLLRSVARTANRRRGEQCSEDFCYSEDLIEPRLPRIPQFGVNRETSRNKVQVANEASLKITWMCTVPYFVPLM